MIRPTNTFATADEIASLMRPLYETKPQFDKTQPCVACEGTPVKNGFICRLCRGTGWRLHGTAPRPKPEPKIATGRQVKYPDSVVKAIRQCRHLPLKAIAAVGAKYGMSYSQARRIAKGECRR